MSETKFFSPALTGPTPTKNPAPINLLPDLSRQQLALLTEIACTLLRNSEAMHKIQQQAAHHASLRHEAAMQKLRTSCTIADLLDIQSDLLCFDLERAGQYWQQLTAVMLQMPVEIMTSASHVHDSPAGESLKSTLHALEATLPLVNGFFPQRAALPD